MSRFLSKRFAALQAYTPGEQPQDMQYIKLNTNESPYPPSPLVRERVSVAEVEKLQLYPDPECKQLIAKLAKRYDVQPENIAVGNGSDEILAFAFMAFCDKQPGVAFPEISYGFYEVYAQLYGLDYEKVPLQADLSIDPADYYSKKKPIVIANPNAPSGLSLTTAQIEDILRSNPDHIVLIDEAYVDFGGQSCVPLTKQYKNLLVVQTFSKSRSLAGGRLGFAVGDGALIQDLNTMKFSFNPYSINRLTLLAGEASIDSDAYYMDNVRKIIDTREYTKAQLEQRGFVQTDSVTNFLFAKHPSVSGQEMYRKLREKGILVRHFGTQKIKDYVRITVGTRQQMDRLLAAMDEILQEG